MRRKSGSRPSSRDKKLMQYLQFTSCCIRSDNPKLPALLQSSKLTSARLDASAIVSAVISNAFARGGSLFQVPNPSFAKLGIFQKTDKFFLIGSNAQGTKYSKWANLYHNHIRTSEGHPNPAVTNAGKHGSRSSSLSTKVASMPA